MSNEAGSIQILIKTIYDATGIRMTEADLQKFVSSGDQAKNAANAIGTAAQTAKSNMDALAASLGVGAGVGALLGLAKAEAATAMETQRLSLVMNMSVEDTSRWAYAMKMATGHSDGLSMAAFHASNALEEIRSGTGKAAEAAHAMGIDPAGLKGIPDLLLKLSDFIQSSALPQEEKLSVAHAILGRSARELYPLLAKGGDGIRELAAQADAAGAVIDQSMVDASRKFTIELDKLQNQLKKGIGLPIVEFAAAHPEIVKCALAVVALSAAYKTLQMLGIVDTVAAIGARIMALTTVTATEAAAEVANTAAKTANTAARIAQTSQIPLHILAAQGETAAVVELTAAEVAEATAAGTAAAATTGLSVSMTTLATALTTNATAALSGLASQAALTLVALAPLAVVVGAVLDVALIYKDIQAWQEFSKAVDNAKESIAATKKQSDDLLAKWADSRNLKIKSAPEIEKLTGAEAGDERGKVSKALYMAQADGDKARAAALRNELLLLTAVIDKENARLAAEQARAAAQPENVKPVEQSAANQLANEEGKLKIFQAQAAARKEAGEETVVRAKFSVDSASSYADRKKAETDLRTVEKTLHAERLADIRTENDLREAVAVRKFNIASQDSQKANREVAAATTPQAKAEAQTKADEAYSKAVAAGAELDAERIAGARRVDAEQKKFQAEQASESKKDIEEERKNKIAAQEAIIADEKRAMADRIAAIREKYRLEEQLKSPEEKAKLESEKNKEIAGLDKKMDAEHRGERLDTHADSLSKVGLFVGGRPASGTAEWGKKTHDLLEHITRDGVKIYNLPGRGPAKVY